VAVEGETVAVSVMLVPVVVAALEAVRVVVVVVVLEAVLPPLPEPQPAVKEARARNPRKIAEAGIRNFIWRYLAETVAIPAMSSGRAGI
jgi:hypothetical protein